MTPSTQYRLGTLIFLLGPAFPFGLGGEGLRLRHVPFVHHAAAPADAAPFLHDAEAAEKIGLPVEPMELAHVARGIDAGEMHGAHNENFSLIAATKAAASSTAWTALSMPRGLPS